MSRSAGTIGRGTGWYTGLSAYWFATSFKWFIVLFLLPTQVQAIVPGGEKGMYWGLVAGIGSLEAVLGPALFGFLSDRSSAAFGRRKPFIAIGAALTALALLWLANAGSVGMFILGYLLLQISDDIATGPYSALIPDLVPENERDRASGIMGLLQLLAQVVAAGVGFALTGKVLAIYIAIAAVNILLAGVVLWTIRHADEAAAPRAARRPFALKQWLAPFRSSDFRWVWLTRALNSLGFYMIVLYLVYYLRDSVRVFRLGGLDLKDPLQAVVLLAVSISLAGALSSVLAAKLASRLGRKRVIVLAGWLMFGAVVPFSLFPVYGPMLAFAVLFGLGYGAYAAEDWALATSVLPDSESTAKDMGIWQMSVSLPQIACGAAGGLIDALNRRSAGSGYTTLFLFASLAFLAGSLLIVKVRGST